MRVVGKRREREIVLHASGALLREGAHFNSEMQKFQSSLCFPKGLYHYRTHAEADQHWNECVAATMAALQIARHG